MQQTLAPQIPTGKKFLQDQQQNKTELFQSVLAKYFEVIQTILPRISTLYLENQQFQRNLFTLESKTAKIKKDHQNLHYEMRANHLSIDNKLNHILADYSNISKQYSRIKQQNDQLCRQVKEIKNIQATQKQIVFQRREEGGVMQFKKQKNKKITYDQNYSENHEESNQPQRNKKSLRFYERKNTIDVDLQQLNAANLRENMTQNRKFSDSRSYIEPDSAQSIQDSKLQSVNFTQRNQTIAVKSQTVMLRKTNLKSSARLSNAKEVKRQKQGNVSRSQKVFGSKSDQSDSSDKYKQIRKEIQDFYKKNQNMKKNYEYLMGEYCRSNEQQYVRIQKQINELKTKIAEIDILHIHFQKVKIQIDNKINNNYRQADMKINNKVQCKQFHDFIDQTNARLTAIHEQRRKVANKEETKKAMQFLQKKLNYVIDEVLRANQHKYPKLHLVEMEISHLNSRVTALPINRQKSCLITASASKTAKNSEYSTRNATVQAFTTKIQAQSVHKNIRSDKLMNQQQCDLNSTCKENRPEGMSSWRSGKKSYQRDNITYLRDRSRELLRRDDKTKNKAKLRKQRMIFEYD